MPTGIDFTLKEAPVKQPIEVKKKTSIFDEDIDNLSNILGSAQNNKPAAQYIV